MSDDLPVYIAVLTENLVDERIYRGHTSLRDAVSRGTAWIDTYPDRKVIICVNDALLCEITATATVPSTIWHGDGYARWEAEA